MIIITWNSDMHGPGKMSMPEYDDDGFHTAEDDIQADLEAHLIAGKFTEAGRQLLFRHMGNGIQEQMKGAYDIKMRGATMKELKDIVLYGHCDGESFEAEITPTMEAEMMKQDMECMQSESKL